jgi:hypothetical protein
MLTAFKGELSLDDILWNLPKKRLLELREARKERLLEEQKEMEQMEATENSNRVRQQILAR